MKNQKIIIQLSIALILFALWFITGMFIFMLIGMVITNITTSIKLKNEINHKLHIALSIILFGLTLFLEYYFEGKASLIGMSLFLVHSCYILYKEFKSL